MWFEKTCENDSSQIFSLIHQETYFGVRKIKNKPIMAYNNNISILWIMDMPDQILELSSQVTQPIKDALGEAFCKILDFLREIKEKVTSLPSVFCSTAQCTVDVQDNEASTPEISTRSLADRIADLVPYSGSTEPESGE